MGTEEGLASFTTLQEYFVSPLGKAASYYYERKQADLAANTKSLEADLWDRLIAPHLALTTLDNFSVVLIEDWRDDLLNSGTGPSSVERALKIVKKVLQDAAHRGIIPSNPAHGVSFPETTKRLVVPLDPEETERIAWQLAPEEAFFVRMLGGTGMRPSELLGTGESKGVRWSDLTIPTRGPARLRVTSGKTGGTREIRLLSPVVDDLILRREEVSPGPEDFLMPSQTGNSWNMNKYRNWRGRKWKKAVRTAGLDHNHRVYDLRHGFASLLIHEGRSMVYVARQMGNSVAVVTETYAHILDRLEAQGNSMNASDALRAAREVVADERSSR